MHGPPRELHELFLGCSRRLVITLAAVTGSIDEAEECVAEAFARAAARWGRLHTYDDPEGWIRRVALNVARSRWRQLRRLQRNTDVSSPELSEDHVALVEALRKLPRAQREAVALHYLLDMRIDDIARTQGVAVGTVKARLARGRASLAGMLAVDDEEMSRP